MQYWLLAPHVHEVHKSKAISMVAMLILFLFFLEDAAWFCCMYLCDVARLMA